MYTKEFQRLARGRMLQQLFGSRFIKAGYVSSTNEHWMEYNVVVELEFVWSLLLNLLD